MDVISEGKSNRAVSVTSELLWLLVSYYGYYWCNIRIGTLFISRIIVMMILMKISDDSVYYDNFLT